MGITVPTSSGPWDIYDMLYTVPGMLQILDKCYLVRRVIVILAALETINHKNHVEVREDRQMEEATPVGTDGETKQELFLTSLEEYMHNKSLITKVAC